jgi:tRNA dimethylallyltransferase
VSVLAIFGPTASGKSAVAEAIAKRFQAELVSADSMQVYRGLPVLTNQSGGRTHLVGIWPLEHEGSVGEYERLAHETIDGILERGRTPVVVGGTGLYLRAALADLEIPPRPRPGVRERFDSLYEERGAEAAHAALAERDPAAAADVHPNDRRRVVRALELAELGSSLRRSDARLWTDETRYLTTIFGLELPRELLHRRIDERTRRMFELGVVGEVRRALSRPLSSTARQILGLREVAELPRDEAVEALVVATRRFAAYQQKWMRRMPGLVPVRGDRPAEEVAAEILAAVQAHTTAEPAG